MQANFHFPVFVRNDILIISKFDTYLPMIPVPNGSSKKQHMPEHTSHPSCLGPHQIRRPLQRRRSLPVLKPKPPSDTTNNLTSRARTQTSPGSATYRLRPIRTQRSTLAIRAKRPKPLPAVRSAKKKHTHSRSGPPTPRDPDIPRGCRPINRRRRPDLLIFSGLPLPRAAPAPIRSVRRERSQPGEVCPASPFSSFPSSAVSNSRRRRCRENRGRADFLLVSISRFVGWGSDGLGALGVARQRLWGVRVCSADLIRFGRKLPAACWSVRFRSGLGYCSYCRGDFGVLAIISCGIAALLELLVNLGDLVLVRMVPSPSGI